MQTSRRILFNPTSIPSLRTKPSRRDFYNAGKIPRVGLRRNPDLWRSIRRESTETGEDQTGHIVAGKNEGILFFDSKSQCPNQLHTFKLTENKICSHSSSTGLYDSLGTSIVTCPISFGASTMKSLVLSNRSHWSNELSLLRCLSK